MGKWKFRFWTTSAGVLAVCALIEVGMALLDPQWRYFWHALFAGGATGWTIAAAAEAFHA